MSLWIGGYPSQNLRTCSLIHTLNAALEILSSDGSPAGSKVRYDGLFNGFYWDAQLPGSGMSGGGQYDLYDRPGYRLSLPRWHAVLPRQDRADRHRTYGTRMVDLPNGQAGANQWAEVRHTDTKLTMNVYTDPDVLELAPGWRSRQP